MVESGTATDNVLRYAHRFVLQHSIASDIESLFVDVRRWDQAARQDGDEGDLDESDEVSLCPLKEDIQPIVTCIPLQRALDDPPDAFRNEDSAMATGVQSISLGGGFTSGEEAHSRLPRRTVS